MRSNFKRKPFYDDQIFVDYDSTESDTDTDREIEEEENHKTPKKLEFKLDGSDTETDREVEEEGGGEAVSGKIKIKPFPENITLKEMKRPGRNKFNNYFSEEEINQLYCIDTSTNKNELENHRKSFDNKPNKSDENPTNSSTGSSSPISASKINSLHHHVNGGGNSTWYSEETVDFQVRFEVLNYCQDGRMLREIFGKDENKIVQTGFHDLVDFSLAPDPEHPKKSKKSELQVSSTHSNDSHFNGDDIIEKEGENENEGDFPTDWSDTMYGNSDSDEIIEKNEDDIIVEGSEIILQRGKMELKKFLGFLLLDENITKGGKEIVRILKRSKMFVYIIKRNIPKVWIELKERNMDE